MWVVSEELIWVKSAFCHPPVRGVRPMLFLTHSGVCRQKVTLLPVRHNVSGRWRMSTWLSGVTQALSQPAHCHFHCRVFKRTHVVVVRSERYISIDMRSGFDWTDKTGITEGTNSWALNYRSLSALLAFLPKIDVLSVCLQEEQVSRVEKMRQAILEGINLSRPPPPPPPLPPPAFLPPAVVPPFYPLAPIYPPRPLGSLPPPPHHHPSPHRPRTFPGESLRLVLVAPSHMWFS